MYNGRPQVRLGAGVILAQEPDAELASWRCQKRTGVLPSSASVAFQCGVTSLGKLS